jgi:nitrous oxidase accessory protein NosD
MGEDFAGEARIEGRQIADGQVGEDAVDELRREFTHAPVPCGARSWLCCPKEVIALQPREPHDRSYFTTMEKFPVPFCILCREKEGLTMIRKLLVLAVLTLFVTLVVLGNSSVSAATTHWVNEAELTPSPPGTSCADAGYMTISAAVAAASPGDTIEVCPGTYLEQVMINKTLTLKGAQAGVDARTRPFLPDPTTQSIIDHPCGPVQIMADKVVLDGFTVQGSILPDPCFLAGIWTNPGFSGTQGGHQILNNIVQNNISGIELDSTCTNPTLVQYNLIQNNNNPGPGAANGIQTNFGLCKATIDSNKFSGHINSSFLVVAPSSNIDVTSNELVAGMSERIVFGAVNTGTIIGNVSTGSTSSATIRLFGGDSNVKINDNTLLNGMRGIRVDDPFGIGINFGVTAHFNCIKGNTFAGLQVDTAGHLGNLNAENNWWGSASGPMNASNPGGTGDAVVDPDNNVDFTPWLTSPPGPPCPAAPNTPGKGTGGGKIESPPTGLDLVLELATLLINSSSNPASVGGQATFGFSVKCCPPKGNLEYNDHNAKIQIKATSVTTFVISPSTVCPMGKHAQFKGMATQSGTPGSVMFTVDVDDCGEPGSSTAGGMDMFSINTTAGYSASGPLIGGNIQIKPAQ